jgi:hypothetical protein
VSALDAARITTREEDGRHLGVLGICVAAVLRSLVDRRGAGLGTLHRAEDEGLPDLPPHVLRATRVGALVEELAVPAADDVCGVVVGVRVGHVVSLLGCLRPEWVEQVHRRELNPNFPWLGRSSKNYDALPLSGRRSGLPLRGDVSHVLWRAR